jgi:hypothetical protein
LTAHNIDGLVCNNDSFTLTGSDTTTCPSKVQLSVFYAACEMTRCHFDDFASQLASIGDGTGIAYNDGRTVTRTSITCDFIEQNAFFSECE